MTGKRFGLEETVCKSCAAPIYFAIVDKTRKRIPIDVTPVTNGNIIFVDGFAHYVTMFDQVGEHDPLFISHFATCKDADKWRKKGSGNGRTE